MTTAADVLNVARAEIGNTDDPRGSNNVKYNTWYYGRPVRGDSYPWCAAFASWVADRAGAIAAGIIPKHAYTPSGAAWFKARGLWGGTPRVGALVYYNISGLGRISHVGIVEAVNADGSFTAIEGNTGPSGDRVGGRVMRQRRTKVGAGGGFGYPAYGGASTPAAPSAAAGAPPVLPWPFPNRHYVGDRRGPAASRGGANPGPEREFVKNVQQWLIYKGCVPGVEPARWASSGWADGLFDRPASTDAARRFHDRYYPDQPQPEQIWSDDYRVLTR